MSTVKKFIQLENGDFHEFITCTTLHCVLVNHAYVFVEVSFPTKITNILPHEKYPLYTIVGEYYCLVFCRYS